MVYPKASYWTEDPVHSRVNEGVKQDIGDQKQDVNYILSSNRQVDREGQPQVETVLKNIH